MLEERPKLQAELKKAQEDAGQLSTRQAEAEAAKAQADAQRLKVTVAKTEVGDRGERAGEVGKLQGRLKSTQSALGEMEADLKDYRNKFHGARGELEAAEEAHTARRDEFDSAQEAVSKAHARAAACDKLARRATARDADRKLKEIEEEKKSALDPAAWRTLQDSEIEVARLKERLGREGTVLAVKGEGALRWAVGLEETVEVSGLGQVQITPASPGLAIAVRNAHAADVSLRATLGAADVPSFEDAQDRREERISAEIEEKKVKRELARLIPKKDKSLAGMAVSVGEAETKLENLRTNLAKVESLATQLKKAKAALSSNSMDEDAWGSLQSLNQALELARVRQENLGTTVTVEALGSTSLAVDEGEPEALSGGDERAFTLSSRTVLAIGDTARVTVVPGGEDQKVAAETFRQAKVAFADRLKELGARDMDAAKSLHEDWRNHNARRAKAEESLQELAPRGVKALEQQVETRASELAERKGLLELAERAQGRLEELADLLTVNKVTADALAELEGLDTELKLQKECVGQLAARVALPDGEARIIAEVETILLPDGRELEVTPGEGGAEAKGLLTDAQDQFQKALLGAAVADMKAAEKRRAEALTLGERLKAEQRRLDDSAPGGLKALEEECKGLEDLEGLDSQELSDTAKTLETKAKGLKSALGETKVAKDAAYAQVEVARDGLTKFEAQVGQKRGEEKTLASNLHDSETALDVERKARSDEDLNAILKDAQALAATLESASKSLSALVQDLVPEVLKGELERARHTLKESQDKEAKLNKELSGLEALLGRASAEGRFEELGEAQAELEDVRSALSRLERDAGAAKLLWECIRKAYESAQRRFLAPVVKEARPYLQKLRPGTTITMNPDLSLNAIVRMGAQEEFHELSGGTREQLSVIVRLALARVLARDGGTMPLILDDTMGWTDDRRFLDMVGILRHASNDLQIIVLTCHPSRGARFQAGLTIELDELKKQAEGARA